MWKVLQKYGIPPKMVQLIESLHEEMTAVLQIHGEALEGDIDVSNGLRQGCVLAPVLFILFFNLTIEAWRQECSEVGITILYKADGCLIGSRARMDRTRWAELLFVDGMAVVTRARSGMVHALEQLFEVTSQ